MKFIVSSSALLKNLQAISGVLNSSNTLPILDNFLFDLKKETLMLTASDLHTTMTASVEVTKAEEPGKIAIPAKTLLDTLKTFSDVPLSFTVDSESCRIEISAGEGKYKLSGYKSDDFPKVPTKEGAASFEMKSSALSNVIRKTIFATGNDELRPVMAGVYCLLTPEYITFVATDAHKLVRYRRLDVKTKEEVKFILPSKPLNQLKNILGFDDTIVKIDYNQTNAFFAYENINIACRLIDGKYPNYEAVIPTENPNKLIIDRKLFLTAIKRIAIFANQSTHQVRFKITGRELVLSSEDLDYSNEAKERLTCQYEGEDLEIGFNSKFIIEMLNNMDADEICLEMSAPNRAGILLPSEKENKDDDILMLVMPVMLNN